MMQNNNLMQLFQQANQMIQGKSPEQIQQMINNLANERGVDLNQMSQQQLAPIATQLQSMGIKLN